MAKDDKPGAAPKTSPGGSKTEVQENVRTATTQEQTVEDKPVTVTDQQRVDRILIHLGYLEVDLQALLVVRGGMAGPIRQAAAELKQQMPGEAKEWGPLKVIRAVLQKAQETAAKKAATQRVKAG